MCVEYKKWMQRLADGVDLAEEVLPGVPIVELAGSNRVLIERHDGMTEYSRERIYVKVSYGVVCMRFRVDAFKNDKRAIGNCWENRWSTPMPEELKWGS